MHVGVCHGMLMEVRGQSVDLGLSFPSCVFWGLYSGYQARQQVLLLSEPTQWPQLLNV